VVFQNTVIVTKSRRPINGIVFDALNYKFCHLRLQDPDTNVCHGLVLGRHIQILQTELLIGTFGSDGITIHLRANTA
jgi:hypothetical protein